MATQNRRATRSSSTKRPAAENGLKFTAVSSSQQAKRRAPLGNLTNQANSSKVSARSTTGTVGNQGRTGSTDSKVKKTAVTHVSDVSLFRNSAHTSSALKPVGVSTSKDNSLPRKDGQLSSFVSLIAPRSTTLSPSRSDGGSISLDETMSTCDSVKSPDFEYIDTGDASIVDSLERITCHNLYISKQSDAEIGTVWKSDILTGMEIDERKVINVDDNLVDTQLCAEYACDIYNHLRNAETKKRPAIDFMEGVQKDINASMRAILIDWLVEVAEEYRLIPDTLYLTVNYIDRYLSGNAMNRQRLQLLGVACMMIAAKYEEICAPQVEEFCFITDNTYFRDEVLQMESAVLKYLKFELTAPTVKCFLRRFVRAAQESTEVPSLQLEFLANYLAELSLLEYNLLCYSPSLIAASAIFLAKFILQHSKRPWNATLRHYTQYQPSELCNCVKALQSLFCNSHNSTLPAIKEKYSQHKYKFVAKKYCPPSIPCEFFSDVSN